MTRVLPAFLPAEIQTAAAEAAALLRAGQPVALPSETVYGLAADAFNAEACGEIFAAKDRPLYDPLIVHIGNTRDLSEVAAPNALPNVETLIEEFWPGPLTLILPKNPAIPHIVTSGLDTVAVRFTAHPVFQAVLAAFGSPLAAPSANRFGRISPTNASHVLDELGGRVPLIVDAGPCEHGIESTIVAVTEKGFEILRQGPITADNLRAFGPVLSARAKAVAPGSMKSHYAPATPLELIGSVREVPAHLRSSSALLSWRPQESTGFMASAFLTAKGDSREAAVHLYAAMRQLDAVGARRIFVEEPPLDGLGTAIFERLKKAAAHGEVSA